MQPRMRRVGLGFAVLFTAAGPATAGGNGLDPAIAVITSGMDGRSSDTARKEVARVLSARLRTLGARLMVPSAEEGRHAPSGINKVTTGPTRMKDVSAADLVIAVSTEPTYRRGTYTSRLSLTLRAVVYPVDGGRARTLTATQQRRLPWSCDRSCAGGKAGAMAGDAARALAPRVMRMARRLVPVPARRLTFTGFGGQEIKVIRSYLRVFPGFYRMGEARRHRGGAVIRYHSRLDAGRLEAALHKMLGHLNTAGAISRADQEFLITKAAETERDKHDSRDW